MEPSELEREQAEDCPLGELHHGTGFQALRHDRRIAELEAELADVVRRHNENCGRENATLLRRIAEFEEGYARLEAEVERLTEELRYCHAGHLKERDDG